MSYDSEGEDEKHDKEGNEEDNKKDINQLITKYAPQNRIFYATFSSWENSSTPSVSTLSFF